MRVICCVDDNMGMMFHNRRQSRDRLLIMDIMEMCRNKRLWAAGYSRKMLEEYQKHGKEGVEIIIDQDYLKKAGKNDFCFVEGILPVWSEKNIDELILYRWNRKYPADIYLEIDLNKWNMIRSVEFPGKSHKLITKEIYLKKIACASK